MSGVSDNWVVRSSEFKFKRCDVELVHQASRLERKSERHRKELVALRMTSQEETAQLRLELEAAREALRESEREGVGVRAALDREVRREAGKRVKAWAELEGEEGGRAELSDT